MDVGNYAPGPRSGRDSFFDKMKKKPDVQAVLDDLDNYTVEQLLNLEGTHFPQWVRDALVRKKEKTTKSDVLARVQEIADKMSSASEVQRQPVVQAEYVPITDTPSPTDRRITSADFALPKERTGTILDSSTHGRPDEESGFEEHMRKIREQMRNK